MPKLKDSSEDAFGGVGDSGISSISVVSINKTGSIASGLNSQSDTLKIRKLQASIVENQKYDAPEHVVNSLRRRKKKGDSELSLPAQDQLKDIDIDKPVNGSERKDISGHSKSKQAPEVVHTKPTHNEQGSMDTLRSAVSESTLTRHVPMGMYSEGMHMPDVDFLPDDIDNLDIDDIEDISEFKFEEYAKGNFHGASHVYERVLLQQPLLQHENIGDQLASLAVWVSLLRFMGDIPDAKGEHGAKEYIPMMLKIYQTLGHKYSAEDLAAAQQLDINLDDANNNKSDNKENGKKRHSKKILGKISKKSQSGGHGGGIKFSSYLEGGNPMLEDRKTTDLEKIQFIIGTGLLRPHLRDEILCQICKQVSNNPSEDSTSRGWVALALCLSCFAPSLDMLNYLCCFIDEGPEDYADYVAEKLDRTLMNGPRKEPPSFLELEGAQRKAMRHLTVRVTLPDSTTKALLLDSASTASDVCRQLVNKLGIKERVGFSLFISLYDKIMSLGSGNEHVFDAICQAEQISCEAGVPINESPWQLTFRKETFTPWYDPKEDAVGTNLIYHQVIHGIKNGDFPCRKEDDLVMITATQYYIDFGHEMKPERLQNMLPLYLPEKLIKDDTEDWIKKISLAHQNCNYVKRDIPVAKAKADVVGYAKHKWPMAFTTFYEAFKYAGPRLQENDVVIGVNASGVFIFTYDGRLMIHWIFPEIVIAYSSRGAKQHGQSVTIATVHNEEYTFTSPDALHVKQILALFLKGLKKRSRYVMVLQGSTKAENPSHLVFMKGDVIKLDREYDKALLNSGWCNGENVRTKARGEFRAEGIYVLPAIKEPSRKMIKVIADYVSRQPLEWLTAQDQVDENRGSQPLEDYGTKSKKFSVA